VLLERCADMQPARIGDDASHVRVQAQAAAVEGEEADGSADHALAVEGAGHVAIGMCHGAHQIHRHHRRSGAPDLREDLVRRRQVRERGEEPGLDPRAFGSHVHVLPHPRC